jgi:hypothetical protein
MYYISRSMRSAKKGIKNGEEEDNEILIWNWFFLFIIINEE